jgi:polysaccharide deacetylase 2 family uncharacterized protein YibQ
MTARRRTTRRPSATRSKRGGRRWLGWLLLVGVVFAAGVYLGSRRSPQAVPADGPEAAGVQAPAPTAKAAPRPVPPPAAEPYADLGTDDGATRSEGAAPTTTAEEVDPAVPAGGPVAHLALVIDDLGRSLADLDTLQALRIPLTYAVLPYESMTRQVVATLRKREVELILHLPMEAAGGENPGPGALTSTMSPTELRQTTLAALAAVPGATGVNNHMGSELSADPRAMRAVLQVLAERELFFLDSRTSPASVGYQTARELGLPAAERQVFLDADPQVEAVRTEWNRWLELARGRGAAIAIGHPHPGTLAVLAEEVPRARAAGFEFVPVSFLLERDGGTE